MILFLLLFIVVPIAGCCVMVQRGHELANPDGKVRRPLRAFLITPVFAATIHLCLSAISRASRTNIPDVRTFVLAQVDGYAPILPIAVGLISVIMLIFVMPVYAILKQWKIENAVVTVLAAGAISAFFYAAPTIVNLLGLRGSHSTFSYYREGCQIIFENVRTACGWMIFFRSLSVYTVTGLLSGAFFWRLYAGRWVMRL